MSAGAAGDGAAAQEPRSPPDHLERNTAVLGVIGGSGLYAMAGLEDKHEVAVPTPFGMPSDVITVATLHGIRIAFIPRHGRSHHVTPTEVNYRANIWALKSLGVQYLISVTAVGSLVQEMAPGNLAIVTQLIDKTYAREATFFGRGVVAHVPMGHPTCDKLGGLVRAASAAGKFPGVTIHPSATAVTMEGPAFSTQAESLANKGLNAHLIGMTSATECKLAREAEIGHLILGLVTDYDSWSDEEGHVDVARVMETMRCNAINAQKVIGELAEQLSARPVACEAHEALKVAIMTHRENIPTQTFAELKLIIGKYFPPAAAGA